MADFCKQCSIENYNEDSGDLRGIAKRDLTSEEKLMGNGWPALCEGCGPTIVDDEGKCISSYCLKKHAVVNDAVERSCPNVPHTTENIPCPVVTRIRHDEPDITHNPLPFILVILVLLFIGFGVAEWYSL